MPAGQRDEMDGVMANSIGDIFEKSLRTFLKPLIPYWDDPTISSILINGPDDIWIEQHNQLQQIEESFSTDHLHQAIRHIAQLSGVLISEENPQLHTTLPDGAEISILLPPISKQGPVVSLQKAQTHSRSLREMVQEGSLSYAASSFLQAAIIAQQSILIVGPPGSDRTSLMQALVQHIPMNERLICLESSKSTNLHHAHVLQFSLNEQLAQMDEKGRASQAFFQMLPLFRPHRLLIEILKGAETLPMIQMVGSGYPGSIATLGGVHIYDALQQLEAQCLLAERPLTQRALRAQIASAFRLIVICQRSSNGENHIASITELLGLDQDGDYKLLPLFARRAASPASSGIWEPGALLPAAHLPSFWPRLQELGFEEIDRTFFHPDNYNEYGEKMSDQEHEVLTPAGKSQDAAPSQELTTLPASLIAALTKAQEHTPIQEPAPVPSPTEVSVAKAPEVPKEALETQAPPTPPPSEPEAPKEPTTAELDTPEESEERPEPAQAQSARDMFPFHIAEQEPSLDQPQITPVRQVPPSILEEEKRKLIPPNALLGTGPKETPQEQDQPQAQAQAQAQLEPQVSEMVHEHSFTPEPAQQTPTNTDLPPHREAAGWGAGGSSANHHSPLHEDGIIDDASQILDLSDMIMEEPSSVSRQGPYAAASQESQRRQEPPAPPPEPAMAAMAAMPATRAGMLPQSREEAHKSPYMVDEEPTHSGIPVAKPAPVQRPPTGQYNTGRPSSPPPAGSAPAQQPLSPSQQPHPPARSVVVRRGRRTGVHDMGSFSASTDNDSTSIRAKPPTVPKMTRQPTQPPASQPQPHQPHEQLSIETQNSLATEATVIRSRPLPPKK